MIKYVEHTIYGGNNNEFDLSPNEISYGFFNYGIFAGQFSININLFGGKTNTGLNVNLGFEDQKKVRELLDELENYCINYSNDDNKKKEGSKKNVTYIDGTDSLESTYIYNDEKCNEIFKKIVRIVENANKSEFSQMHNRIKKSVLEKDSQFHLTYKTDDYKIFLSYDSFNDDYMYFNIDSKYYNETGGIGFPIDSNELLRIKDYYRLIKSIIENNPSKESMDGIRFKFENEMIEGNFCSIQSKDTENKEHFIFNNEEIDSMMNEIIADLSITNPELEQFMNRIDNNKKMLNNSSKNLSKNLKAQAALAK